MRILTCLALALMSSVALAQIPRHERMAMRRAAAVLWPEAANDPARLDALIDEVAGLYDGRDEEDRVTRMQLLAAGVVDAVHRARAGGATADDLRLIVRNVLRAHQLDVARGRRAANAVTARTLLGLASLLTVASGVDLGYLASQGTPEIDALFIALSAPVPPLFLAGFFYAFGREYPRVVPGTGLVGKTLDRHDYLREFENVLNRAFADTPAWVDATTESDPASANILSGVGALVAEHWGATAVTTACEAMLAPVVKPETGRSNPTP